MIFSFLFVCLFDGRLKSELIRFFKLIFCPLFYLEFGYVQFTIWLVTCIVCAHYDACNTVNAIFNPWTASKSDHATKIIVTFLFNDGFQKCRNSFTAEEILFGKWYYLYYIKWFLLPKKNPEVRARSFWLTLYKASLHYFLNNY